MDARGVITVLLALALGALGGRLLSLPSADAGPEGLEPHDAPPALVDGRFLVVENQDGHWIYEDRGDGLCLVAERLGPQGEAVVWERLAPRAIATAEGSILAVPEREPGQEEFTHAFYEVRGGKLIRLPRTP